MFDHFSILAPIYERLIPPPDPGTLREMAALTPDSVLLDAAGGTGRVSALFVSVVHRVVLCDTAPGMLKQAEAKGLETVCCGVEALPFDDGEFDAILLVDAFHHLEDQRKALGELLRVLKSTGRLVIEEPDIRRPLVKITAFLEKMFLMRSRFVPPETIMKWIADAGGDATIVRRDHLRVWLVVQKKSRTCLKTADFS
jgi:ubiquinone/menaquinone biosynthesis C-methylase UbiE